jgi:hypothetical protein
MKMDEDALFAVIFALFTVCIICVSSLAFWDHNQFRIMYQQVYQKNIECRINTNNSGDTRYVDKLCGKIPSWEEYNKVIQIGNP